MAHEQEVLAVMDALKIADKHTVGVIMAAKVGWKSGVSATNNSYKALISLAELGKLEKENGYFRIPGCRSEYSEHARLVSQAIAELLVKYPGSIIYREHFIEEVKLRPDVVALVVRGQVGRCLVIEIANNESQQSITAKRHVWENWSGATEYLSMLFGYRIPFFDFIVVEENQPCLQDSPFMP